MCFNPFSEKTLKFNFQILNFVSAQIFCTQNGRFLPIKLQGHVQTCFSSLLTF